MLLAASCYFYMFFIPIYVLILLFTIVIDYYAGIWIEKQQTKHKQQNPKQNKKGQNKQKTFFYNLAQN